MVQKIISKIIELVIKAQELALRIGIPNILQPGLVKEMIISEALGHELITSKRDADYEGGTGQLDRMFKSPTNKRAESLYRITRNKMIYLAIFYKKNPLKIKIIYEIQPSVLLKEAERQLNRSSNKISHVGFSENWAKLNSKIAYQNKGTSQV